MRIAITEWMFDFGNANRKQKMAIECSDGPVLIIAGPGTGKTYTLVQRALYLIEERNVAPENIMIATFTEKAAKELVTRLTNALIKRNIIANLNEMYIGTMHSICLRLIKEHLEYTRLKKNYRTLDDFDQKYLVFTHMFEFKKIKNLNLVIKTGGWRAAKQISKYVNILTEELVTSDNLLSDNDPEIIVLGEILETYQNILIGENTMDFASMQVEAYNLIMEHPAILEEIQNQIQYIMIDEYQDTNYIQEQIVFLLGGISNNICVVGDDDQGLYRFRGATIRNILEFPDKFDKDKCKKIVLTENYRSNDDIVNFYNKWMNTTEHNFEWNGYRYAKTIEAQEKRTLESPSVIKLTGIEDEEEWHKNVLFFIKKMYKDNIISDYNQIAFLSKSIKNGKVTGLMNYLENNGVNVYAPRAGMFFDRPEIKLAIGCMMLLFPDYVKGLDKQQYEYLQQEHYQYYIECIQTATEVLKKEENKELFLWLREQGLTHAGMSGRKSETTDYAYAGLIYRMFEFTPFKNLIDCDVSEGVVDLRAVRNLSLLTQLIVKFEHLYNISVLNGKHMDSDTKRLFNIFLKLLYDEGVLEYEDDSEYAPSGCVSFLTIHQSKGLEFPIVFVVSLSDIPRKAYDDLLRKVEEKYYYRKPFEPYDQMKYFDFWRLYYTAFSRTQDLLVLTCNETERCPSKYFSQIYETLPSFDDSRFDISEFKISEVKDVNLKSSFSFTSHISVYENCALQYKFYKELDFAPVRAGAMIFGMLVHQTIEDVHRAVLRGEENLITENNVQSWFNTNYDSLSKSEHTYLTERQKETALDQVQRYVNRQQGRWETIKETEVDVSLVKPAYIIDGKIDLIKGEGNTVEIIDFKAEKKPDLFADDGERIERYRRQLHLYAYLVEERTKQKVSKMHLYFTGENAGNPLLSFPYNKTSIDSTVGAFDDTVQKILRKDFTMCSNNPKICRECDFRHFCKMDSKVL